VLATQRAATQVKRERALAAVGLIRALGGGWGDRSAPLAMAASVDGAAR
jgi:outer membrane protein TolC